MSAININASTYIASAVGTSSVAVTLTDGDAQLSSVVVHNPGSTEVFIDSSPSGAVAVFPTSATVPNYGIILGANSTGTFSKTIGHGSIAAIRASGTGNVYFSLGYGE